MSPCSRPHLNAQHRCLAIRQNKADDVIELDSLASMLFNDQYCAVSKQHERSQRRTKSEIRINLYNGRYIYLVSVNADRHVACEHTRNIGALKVRIDELLSRTRA
jgi:hypothetical protein